MGKIIFFISVYLIHGYWCSLFTNDIVALNNTNFSQIVLQSSNLWLVEYYASWCGHCQQFAPIFNNLANDLKDWNNIIKFGTVSCPDNTALCFLHSVHGFPTLKFFFPNSTEISSSEKYNGEKSFESIQYAILEKITELYKNENYRKSLPNLDYIQDVNSLWINKTNNVYIIIESDEEQGQNLGQMVILDINKLRPYVMVGRMSIHNDNSHTPKEPGLYKVNSNGIFTNINVSLERNLMSRFILSDVHIDSPKKAELSSNISNIELNPLRLHMMDLHSNLIYTFLNEIPLKINRHPNNFAALQKYLYLLVKYHPAHDNLKRFLQSLYNWYSKQKATVTSDLWLQKIKNLQIEFNLDNRISWYACKGSEEHLRGFPCSLWMTMHAITVNAYILEKNNTKFLPLSVLLILRNYILEFFTCNDCANNFDTETRDWLAKGSQFQDHSQVVLELWRVHNNVNNRLHFNKAEDLAFPKYQFPKYDDCTACRTKNGANKIFDTNITDWREDNVLDFLIKFYSIPIPSFNFDADRHISFALPTANKSNCSLQISNWSLCSKSCDTGVSTRLSNQNSDCKLKLENRLCLLRPCNIKMPNISDCAIKGTTFKIKKPIPLNFNNCSSVNLHRFTVCGFCKDGGCCLPSSSYTKSLKFSCNFGAITSDLKLSFEFIRHCDCSPKYCN